MIEVRAADEVDFGAWAQMRAELWPTSTPEEHLAELIELSRRKTFQGWVAIDKDRCIGFAEASVRDFANGCDSQPVIFIEGIWVDEIYRKSGVGRQFVDGIENWARFKGVFEIGSDSAFTNSLSHVCHQKWGFEETERVVYFRKKLI